VPASAGSEVEKTLERFANPETTPADDTVATRGFEELQLNVWPAIVAPLELCAEATSEMVDPMKTLVVVAASTAIDATGPVTLPGPVPPPEQAQHRVSSTIPTIERRFLMGRMIPMIVLV
jgi:hypothetical protein